MSAPQAGVAAARFFGQSMASNGQYLAVGAPYYSGAAGGTNPGVVLIYQRSGNHWNLLNAVQAPVPTNGDGFGAHVSFSGAQLLVGAPYSTVNNIVQRGALYAYNIVAGLYAYTETVNPGIAPAASDWYGFNFSADAGWLAVGIPFGAQTNAGQVQLFRYDGDLERWIYHSAVDGMQAGGRHGIRVLMRGDRLLVGATEEQATISTRGWAYEYQRSGSGPTATWAQVQRFRQTLGAVSVFGSAFALSPSGATLLIGAPYELASNSSAQTGAVFAFTRNGNGQWEQSARIDPPVVGVAENFGTSIAFSDESGAVIGDVREGSSQQLGAAHLYRQPSPGNWSRMASWQRGSGAAGDFMGASLLAVAEQLLIGASGIDNGASIDEGRVFVYDGALGVFRNGFE
ncbi:MAG: hypothetical protein AB7E72_03140 [Lysobacterales bacterium]